MSTNDRLKQYFKNELISTRSQLDISQEKMAERLMMSVRSYSDLEHGKYFCSATVLINFVNNCDIDRDELFSEFAKIIDDTDN